MSNERGFTLVEVLIAVLLIAAGVMAVAPMFFYGVQSSAVGADLGSVGAIAVEHMEQLRSMAYRDLEPGGSLTSDVAGYSDASHAGYFVRWQISDNATPSGSRTVHVRAIAERRVVGRQKDVILSTVRGR